MKDDAFFESLAIKGRIASKVSGPCLPSQTRAVTPLPCILGVIDSFVDAELKKIVDTAAASCGSGFMECAVKRRQILDCTFSLSLHLEKSLDCHGRGAIAGADIKSFYDFIDPLLIYRWLVARPSNIQVAASFLRLHVLPQVELSVGKEVASISCKTLGVFTGTRTAGTAGRIPVLDVASSRMHIWEQLATSYGPVKTCLASFVDNLYTASKDPLDGVALLNDAEQHLQVRWGLTFGRQSKFVMAADGYEGDDLESLAHTDWRVVTSEKVLGHILTNNGSIDQDFDAMRNSMWASFWMNFKPALQKADANIKRRFLDGSVKALGQFRWTRWPYQKSVAKALDQTQSHMVSMLFPTVWLDGESSSDFFRRRSLNSGRLAATHGRWSSYWAAHVRRWHAHVMRGNDTTSWCHHIYTYHNRVWLLERRLNQSRGNETSRTNTRNTRGNVSKRWHDGYEEARVIPPPTPIVNNALSALSNFAF